MTLILNFLSARKIPNVKWHKIIIAEIAAATPNPWDPYANKHIGSPILPVFGIIKGGSSRIISLVLKKNKKITPIKAKAIMAIR